MKARERKGKVYNRGPALQQGEERATLLATAL